MVGAGIYTVIGKAAGEAGPHLWISFVLAGIAAFLTVLAYAELASAFPKAGAEYQFLKQAFPEWPALSFMAGFLIALNAAATAATVSLAFAGYLRVFVDLPVLPVALALLILCTAVNIAGIREATWISIGLICIEVAGLLLVIAGGITAGDLASGFRDLPSVDIPGVFAATALIFFVYIGFEDVANLSEETHEPKKTIPRALLASVILTSVVYGLVAVSVSGLQSPAELAASESPLTAAVGTVSPWMGGAVAFAALFATASTALISLISISRMLFGMARDGDMPAPLRKTLHGRRTPWVAALALFGAACLLLPLGKVEIIASISSAGVILVFVAVQAAMIVLRYRKPNLRRGFVVPFSIGRFPVLPALGIAITLALLTQFSPLTYGIVAGTIVLGAAAYRLRRAKGR